jgi:hypothetical protein
MFHVVHSSKSLEQIVHLYTVRVYTEPPFIAAGPLCQYGKTYIPPPPLSAVLRHCYFVSPNQINEIKNKTLTRK